MSRKCLIAYVARAMRAFRKDITDIDKLMTSVCDYAERQAKKKRCEPFSVIGEITNHGSGVSSAIYELYRRRE